MQPNWDVIVVGAGPAGATAALAARRADPHARVLLLDASDFPRDKVCGDGIARQALDVLAGLGVDASELVAGTRPITRIRLLSPGGAEASGHLRDPAAVVPRRVFDARLVEAALAAGATFGRHRVRVVTSGDDGVELDGALRTRVLIGADGAESVVRRAAVSRPAPRTRSVALALRGYAAIDGWPDGEQLLTMTRARWPAYAWVFPIGDGTANVGYGEVLRERPPTRAELVQRLEALLPGIEPHDLRGHKLPLSTGRPVRVAEHRILLAGDAASLINPLTGEGIYYAALSGALAGAAAVGRRPAETYRRRLAAELGVHLRTTDALAALTRNPAVIDAGIAAAARSRSTFDSLAEIGLGAGRLGPRAAAAVVWQLGRRALPG